jgi:hypothetical protein
MTGRQVFSPPPGSPLLCRICFSYTAGFAAVLQPTARPAGRGSTRCWRTAGHDRGVAIRQPTRRAVADTELLPVPPADEVLTDMLGPALVCARSRLLMPTCLRTGTATVAPRPVRSVTLLGARLAPRCRSGRPHPLETTLQRHSPALLTPCPSDSPPQLGWVSGARTDVRAWPSVPTRQPKQ